MLVQDLVKKLTEDSDRAAAAGDYASAHAHLRRAQERIGKPDGRAVSAELRQKVGLGLWRLNPCWWNPIDAGTYRLRRCRPADSDFYQRAYADPEFSRRFNQQSGWRGDLGKALEKYGSLPPADLGMLMWMVCRADNDQPFGIISFSSIQSGNRRAEFSIGFPARPAAGVAAQVVFLALHFAYFKIRLHKLYTYVYEDNPEARENTLRLGFNQEGTLVDHFYLSQKGFVTVHTFGLTVTQARSSPRLLKLARRYTGEDWTTAMPGNR